MLIPIIKLINLFNNLLKNTFISGAPLILELIIYLLPITKESNFLYLINSNKSFIEV